MAAAWRLTRCDNSRSRCRCRRWPAANICSNSTITSPTARRRDPWHSMRCGSARLIGCVNSIGNWSCRLTNTSYSRQIISLASSAGPGRTCSGGVNLPWISKSWRAGAAQRRSERPRNWPRRRSMNSRRDSKPRDSRPIGTCSARSEPSSRWSCIPSAGLASCSGPRCHCCCAACC